MGIVGLVEPLFPAWQKKKSILESDYSAANDAKRQSFGLYSTVSGKYNVYR